jgi:BMFP domain-containing protein YqiC
VHRLGEPLSRRRLEEEHTQAHARIAELEARLEEHTQASIGGAYAGEHTQAHARIAELEARLEAALDEHAEAKQVCSSAELKLQR